MKEREPLKGGQKMKSHQTKSEAILEARARRAAGETVKIYKEVNTRISTNYTYPRPIVVTTYFVA